MNIIGKEISGDYIYDNGHTIRYRNLTDDEIKNLFDNISLNKTYSLPEKLAQDFNQDGIFKPTNKLCTLFQKADLAKMIEPHRKKAKRKNPPKPKTRKRKIKKV